MPHGEEFAITCGFGALGQNRTAVYTATGSEAGPQGANPVWPANCQPAIDTMYRKCGGGRMDGFEFDSMNARMAATMKAMGCSGTAQSTPVLVAAAAALAHFLH